MNINTEILSKKDLKLIYKVFNDKDDNSLFLDDWNNLKSHILKVLKNRICSQSTINKIENMELEELKELALFLGMPEFNFKIKESDGDRILDLSNMHIPFDKIGVWKGEKII